MSGVVPVLVALMLAPAELAYTADSAVSEAVVENASGTTPTDNNDAADASAPAPANASASTAPDPALLALQPPTIRLFEALKGGVSDEDLEKLVSAAVRELDVNCPQVKEYQVYRTTAQSRTLKVKCHERPLYAVTIGASGEAFVSGGDGTIGPMHLSDGPIKPMLGVRVEEYLARTKAEAKAEAAASARKLDEGGHPARRWLARGAAIIGAGVLAWLGWLALRENRRFRRSLSRWRGLDSVMKDQLIVEAEEIYPNLYRHPEGVFIARGRRGKRRLFSSLVFGYLYSSRGIKLFEIS